MAGKRTVSGETILEYLNDSRWKNTPTKSLAKLIYKENPEVFRDVEHVRARLRYYKGQSGKELREKLSDRSHTTKRAEAAIALGIPNPYGLPDSDEDEWDAYVLPKACTRILLLSDIHVPYHNIEAITKAIEYGKEKKANAIVFNGDTVDCYALSRYEKDPRKRRFAEELEATRQLLKVFREQFPGVPFYFKLGNHEERYEAYMRSKAPELLGAPEFTLDTLLRFGELGCDLIQDKRIIKAGKLNIMHGHEFGRSVFSPVNPARGYYMRSKTTVICGHNHQTSSHTEKNMEGKVVTTWSTGCLCEMHPQYMPVNKWNHGFAFVYVDEKGEFEVDNLSIIDGKIR
jgi:predicted phosphodiesterase